MKRALGKVSFVYCSLHFIVWLAAACFKSWSPFLAWAVATEVSFRINHKIIVAFKLLLSGQFLNWLFSKLSVVELNFV